MMPTPKVLVQVTIFDDSDEVKKTLVRTYDGTYHWEVIRMFEELGIKVADILDPQ